MPRPYISLSIHELEALFDENSSHTIILANILAELSNRKTDRAKRLRQRVASRLHGINNQGNASSASSQADIGDKPIGVRPEDVESDPTEPTTNSSSTASHGGARATTESNSSHLLPPDDRQIPLHFGRISPAGIRGKPDPYQPKYRTDLVLEIAPDSSRAQRYVVALDALVNEMKREGSGQRRYELENGKRTDFQAQRHLYAFPFIEEADIFEEAEIEIQVEGRRSRGQIASIAKGSLLLAIDFDFGPQIERCTLLIDNTALLIALKERLEQAGRGEINVDLGLADAVLDKDHDLRKVEPFEISSFKLNESQANAVRLFQGKAISFLWGPPGTGKTWTLAAFVQAAFEAGKRILVCSNTNKAVDQVLLAVCRRLMPEHSAMQEGRILRIGQIVQTELRDEFSPYVTIEGILGRRSQALKLRQAEIEDQIGRLDARQAHIDRILKQFAALDQGKEKLGKLASEGEALRRRSTSALATRDKARSDIHALNQELGRLEEAGPLRRAFMRSAERIRADLAKVQDQATRQNAIFEDLQEALGVTQTQYAQLSTELQKLEAILRAHDRRALERENMTVRQERDVLVTELEEIARKLADLEAEILRGAKVIGTTVAKSYLRARDLGRFDIVIIDEASMVLLPALYLVTALSTGRVIVSGDFRQLPPIVPSRQQAIHDQIGRDVFECADIDDSPSPHCAMLDVQHRMDEVICGLISHSMYRGLLKTATDRTTRDRPLAPDAFRKPLTIIDTSRLWPFESKNAFGSRFNLLHALLVRNAIIHLQTEGFIIDKSSVGVCTPYAAQAKLLQRVLADNGLDRVDAGTVHRYQGDEKRMMILDVPEGMGASRGIGLFIQGIPPTHVGARVLNVAVSRAMDHLVIVANLTYLEQHLPSTALLRHILYDMQERGHVVDGNDILQLRPIERDLKGLLGIVELDFDAEQLGLFHSGSFSRSCLADMQRATKSIVVFSGFVTPERVSAYGELFRAKVREGVEVRCVTRPPQFNGSMPRAASKEALDALEAVGAVVDCRRDIHEKVVLIDKRIVWSGSLNALSHTSRTDEIMTRVESPGFAEQLAAFLSKRRNVSPSTAAAMVAGAENPRCPRCGSRTYYSEGPYGPYFTCEEEDCGWREGARKQPKRQRAESSGLPPHGPPCPVCGAATKLRQGRFGEFYGCSKFPKCKGKVSAKPPNSAHPRRRKKSAQTQRDRSESRAR